jgi:DNA-binding transcriptional ArsR family regulator
MALRNPVVGFRTAPSSFSLEVEAGTAFELLSALHALTSPNRGDTWAPTGIDTCPPATRAALGSVGDPTGDLWLHLLGLAHELGEPDARAFVARVRRLRPLELRRHLLGRYVPSWCRFVGADMIERAVRGDVRARKHVEREAADYCAETGASFAAVLPLDAAATKTRIVRALATFEEEVLRPQARALEEQLASDAETKRRLARDADPYELIESASGGFRYEHEATFSRVVLVPHLAGAPAILLAEHRDTYLIAYPAPSTPGIEAGLRTIGHALNDASRVAILAHLRHGEATLTKLSDAVGIAKSTAHHHLVQLRAAGLITIRGNSQGRSYTLDPYGIEAAKRTLNELSSTKDVL